MKKGEIRRREVGLEAVPWAVPGKQLDIGRNGQRGSEMTQVFNLVD